MTNHNSFPSTKHAEMDAGSELDTGTMEAISRAQLVKFSPVDFVEQKRQPDADEHHVAILCRTPGDTLTFDISEPAPGSGGNWMNLGKGDIGAAWVVTDRGNRYGIGNGYVYNHNAGSVWKLDHDAGKLQLTVGQEAYLPGVGNTRTVRSILINDEINNNGGDYSWTGKDASAARHVNAVDPLLELRRIGDALEDGGDVASAVAVVAAHASNPLNETSFV